MKQNIFNTVFFILCIATCHCGSGSSSAGDAESLKQTLNGQNYSLSGFDELSADLNQSCASNLDSSPTPNRSFLSVNGGGVVPSAVDSKSSSRIIRFTNDSLTIWENGKPIFTGQWSAHDENTIKVISEDSFYYVDVSIEGDDLKVGSSDLNEASCKNTNQTEDTISPDSPGVSYETENILNIFKGTWCFESGVPLILAFVQTEENEAFKADLINNEAFYKKTNQNLKYSSFPLYEDRFEINSSFPNRVYVGLHGYSDYAVITFTTEAKDKIKIKYGLNQQATFKKSLSNTEGQCEALQISSTSVNLLIEHLKITEDEFFENL